MTPSRAFYTCYNKQHKIQQLEQNISIDPYFSYRYAFELIRGRFEEGESSIATDPECSYLYARNVIKGPFELCHSVIFNSEWRNNYIDFLKSINCDFKEIYEQYGEWLI
jgi:hypothetical protein